MTAEVGLNVFQIIQNELIQREGSRSTIGLGFRLAIIEEKVMNIEAVARNGKIWKLHHRMSPVSVLTPETREQVEAARKRLLDRRGAKSKDDKDPTMMPRDMEAYEVHKLFPRTLLDFKQLQFHPDQVRELLKFYHVSPLRPDLRPVNLDAGDRLREVSIHMETCMEELAMNWGINWQRVGGLSLPQPAPPPSSAPTLAPSSNWPPPSPRPMR